MADITKGLTIKVFAENWSNEPGQPSNNIMAFNGGEHKRLFSILLHMLGICLISGVPVHKEGLPALRQHDQPMVDQPDLNKPVGDLTESDSVPAHESTGVVRSITMGNVQSCYSQLKDHTVPSAHVRGSMSLLSDSSNQLYYSMGWECSSVDGVAFVDGGMNFSASDQSLQVPQSGYYFISSQVYFQVEKSVAQNRAVFHQVLVNSNCNANSRGRVYSQSYASPADGSVELPTVTTHSSLVVKLCTGGKIKVVVPKPPAGSVQGAPCCPYSQPFATFFDAYLISPTN